MNAIGIDVSKGKSTVAVLRPYGEVVVSPFDVAHTGSDLRALADLMIDCQVKCNTIREKIFEAPRRESGN